MVVAVELKRSIAIFPIYAAEGKSHAQVVMYSVRHCFEAMLRRYPRNTKILEEITNDQALDLLLEVRESEVSHADGRCSPNIPVSTSTTRVAATTSSPLVTATATAQTTSTVVSAASQSQTVQAASSSSRYRMLIYCIYLSLPKWRPCLPDHPIWPANGHESNMYFVIF